MWYLPREFSCSLDILGVRAAIGIRPPLDKTCNVVADRKSRNLLADFDDVTRPVATTDSPFVRNMFDDWEEENNDVSMLFYNAYEP